MVTRQLPTLTTSQVAKLLGVTRHTLLRWLKNSEALEPEFVVRFEGRVRHRAFTAGDVEKLNRYQLKLHRRGWRKSANASTDRRAEEGEGR